MRSLTVGSLAELVVGDNAPGGPPLLPGEVPAVVAGPVGLGFDSVVVGELLTAAGPLLEVANCAKLSEDRECMPCFLNTLPLVSVKRQLSIRKIIFLFASA